MHYLNLQLTDKFTLSSQATAVSVDNSWQPGFFSHLPPNSEIQAWWLLPRQPLQPGELARTIRLIEQAIVQLQFSITGLQHEQLRLTTGYLQEDSHYLQIILYTTATDLSPAHTSIYYELTHALLQSFAGMHFPIEVTDQIFTDHEVITKLIESSGQILPGQGALIRTLAKQLAGWIHQSRNKPTEEVFLQTLAGNQSPPSRPRTALPQTETWSQRGLVPDKTIDDDDQDTDTDPDIQRLTLLQQHISAVLRSLMVMGYLNAPPATPIALLSRVAESQPYRPGRWLSSVVHFSQESHPTPVVMLWMNSNNAVIESRCQESATASLPLKSALWKLHVCAPQEHIQSVRGHRNWALNDRAQYLLDLRELLETVHAGGYNTGPISLDQLVLVRTEEGEVLPGILLNSPLKKEPVHSFEFSLQLALDILNTEPAPRVNAYPGDTVLAQILSTVPLPPQLASAILQFIKPLVRSTIDELGSYVPETAQDRVTAIAPRRQIPIPELFTGHPHPLVRVSSAALMRFNNYPPRTRCENCGHAITEQERFHCLFCSRNRATPGNVDVCHNCRGLQPVSAPTDFGQYQQRLNSFMGCWPPMEARHLAASGFYVRPGSGDRAQQTGNGYEISCHGCKLDIQPHLGIEDLWEAHRRLSPECQHVQAFWPVRPLTQVIVALVNAINEAVESTCDLPPWPSRFR